MVDSFCERLPSTSRTRTTQRYAPSASDSTGQSKTFPSFQSESNSASPFANRICTRICAVGPGDVKRTLGPAEDAVMTAAVREVERESKKITQMARVITT